MSALSNLLFLAGASYVAVAALSGREVRKSIYSKISLDSFSLKDSMVVQKGFIKIFNNSKNVIKISGLEFGISNGLTTQDNKLLFNDSGEIGENLSIHSIYNNEEDKTLIKRLGIQLLSVNPVLINPNSFISIPFEVSIYIGKPSQNPIIINSDFKNNPMSLDFLLAFHINDEISYLDSQEVYFSTKQV